MRIKRYNERVVYRLKPLEHSDERLKLGFGLGWRVFFVLVALGFGTTAAGPAGVSVFRLAVALVSAGAAIYREEWLFDRPEDTVRSRVGVLFFAAVQRFALSEVAAVVCRSSYPPGLGPGAREEPSRGGSAGGGAPGAAPAERPESAATYGSGRYGTPPVGTSTGFEFLRRSSGGMLPRAMHRGHVRLWLELTSGRRVHVVTDSVRGYGWVSDLGRTIAQFTRTPFREE